MPKGKTILVTGAGGFIGSHLVEALVTRGAKVRAFCRYNGRGDVGMLSDLPASVLDSLEILFGDVGDPFLVRSAVKGCDYVFHLAALIGIPYSYAAPADYVRVNVQGTVNVLQACRDEGTARLVHTSTSETYGTADYVPIDERHPLKGQSPYSASKIGADKMVESYYAAFGLPVVTVRPFNTFGPRQSARAFIPTCISQALTKDHLDMGSLDPIRDLTFVKDTAEGFIAVGLSDNAVGQTINLGVGRGYSIREVVQTTLRLLGKADMPIRQDAGRIRPSKSEVMRLVSDNSKARELCNWTPTYTLEQGLRETIGWMEANLNRYQSDCYAV